MASSHPTLTTGTSVQRIEDEPLLRGDALFTADIADPRLEGAAHVAFVRSPFAAATVAGIDTSEATQRAGVLAVVTADDLTDLHNSPFHAGVEHDLQPVLLPAEVVRYAGEAVAMVIADDAATALDAAETVVVDYEPTTPVLDLDEARSVSPVESVTVAAEPDDGAFGDAEVIVQQQFWSPRQLPSSIEPRVVAAVWEGPELYVWSATQKPHGFRDTLAAMFALDSRQIHVVAPSVGGGFGGKVSRTPEEHLVPLAARLVERPVRWHETRSENFATATQCRGERIDLTLAGTAEGRLTALRAHLVKDGGAYPLVGVLLPAGYTRPMASGCYDIAHVEFSSEAVLTNRPPTSAYRGAGRSPYVNAVERGVDLFASAVGLDPAEVRRRNLIRPDQMPYETPTGGVYDEADYPGDLQQCLELGRYEWWRAEQRQRRQQGAGLQLGLGLSTYNHMTTGGGGEEAAVRVDVDGSITVTTGTTSQGHGHATTWAQIAGDVLGVDPLTIRVIEGDADAIATGVGAVGSRSLQTAGMAVHLSASQVWERARQLAAELLEASVEDIVSTPGVGLHVVGSPALAVSWAAVAAAGTDTPRELSCGDFYDTEGRNTFPSGCHLAVVEVDVETGQWQLLQLTGVDDAGRRVNPMIVEGQLHGGMASGVGHVLGEVMQWDTDGNPVTTTWLDYPLPTADQLPFFQLAPAETPTSYNDLGFKGVGESGTIGATPAVHNAVIDALSHLGVRHLDLPCTPQRVWEAIRTARSSSPS